MQGISKADLEKFARINKLDLGQALIAMTKPMFDAERARLKARKKNIK